MAEQWVGEKRRRVRTEVFRTKGRVCYLCGHPGSNDVDHVDPKARGGALWSLDNLMPAHGNTESSKCQYCGRKCNREKGEKTLAEFHKLVTSQDWYMG